MRSRFGAFQKHLHHADARTVRNCITWLLVQQERHQITTHSKSLTSMSVSEQFASQPCSSGYKELASGRAQDDKRSTAQTNPVRSRAQRGAA